MSISVRVDTRKLDSMIARTPGKKDQIVLETAFHMLGVAEKTAPYKTGYLAGSGGVKPGGGGGQTVKFTAEYAGYVELGTWKMSAQPFLKPAVEAETQLFIERLKELAK